MTLPQEKQSIGVVMTSGIVIGTVIGSGIFLLPVSLAPLGINAPIAWAVSGCGALCIAFALSRIVRPEGAGLQSYVEAELGATAGFIVTFALWVSCWTAMASTAVAAAAALSWMVPRLSDPWSVAMVAIATTIAVTAINLRGVRSAGGFAVVTVAIRILPLIAAIIAVLSMKAQHQPLAAIAPTPITTDNLATAVTLTLFAIIGFETGTAPVGKVRSPTRTIPLALMAGTSFCVLLYLLSSTSVSLILSPEATAKSLSPFADALKAKWGEMAARLAAVGVAIAAVGGLNSNLLCGGELGFSMGLRRDLPATLGRANRINTPVISLLLAAVLTVLLVLSNTSRSTAQLFIFVSLLTTTATLVVYLIGALAALRRRNSAAATVAIGASILFSLFAFYGAGLEANLWGLALLIAGLVIRWFCHRVTRSPAGSIPAAAGQPAAPPGSSA
jgi:APA family basic amino acid/polyamine antiporter